MKISFCYCIYKLTSHAQTWLLCIRISEKLANIFLWPLKNLNHVVPNLTKLDYLFEYITEFVISGISQLCFYTPPLYSTGVQTFCFLESQISLIKIKIHFGKQFLANLNLLLCRKPFFCLRPYSHETFWHTILRFISISFYRNIVCQNV